MYDDHFLSCSHVDADNISELYLGHQWIGSIARQWVVALTNRS